MPKRKLSEHQDSNGKANDDGISWIQLTRLTQKFQYGVEALSKGLKVARGFERQKLGRREKTAKSDEAKGGTLGRLAEEIEVLKTLDTHKVAEKYLFKQLVKWKRIAELPVFQKFQEKSKISTEGPKSTAEANVTARLYKSTPVKNVLPGIIDGLRQLLGVDGPVGGKKEADKKETGKKEKKENTKTVSAEPASGSGSGDEEEGGEVDMDDADSVDLAQFDARLAPDSEDEDEDEEGGRDLGCDSEDDLQHHSDISDSPPAKKMKVKKTSSAPATSTTFLPSLTMGGYWSGSESEGEDAEGAAEPPRRKNRMGQQARRALWEKKFGAGANHIKNNKGRGGRDDGWDARRGAMGGRGGRAGQQQDWSRPQHRDDQPKRGPKPEDNKPLHPSWEAAKKAKEQKATASFQGKKVVFD
ncbi:Bud-site selection protein [Aspergillus ellipticus CBS 707.79]|uniref:Bud-site selection protein n=1 Tax=Aspergillus ellipticus CBS 707.79 TaxID=1448320 RepID=A0A319D6J4_9EURO|nr:Bud-site selection protein [Aspergillus ellipticus CBS 707.79]